MTKKEHINKILDLVDESRINIRTVDFSLLRRLLEKEIPEQLILNGVVGRSGQLCNECKTATTPMPDMMCEPCYKATK